MLEIDEENVDCVVESVDYDAVRVYSDAQIRRIDAATSGACALCYCSDSILLDEMIRSYFPVEQSGWLALR